MIAETKTTRVDIRQGAAHLVLRAPLATMDNMAHVFEAQVYDGDTAADLSGAKCEAYFIRADGVTVMLDGTVSGSTASVTLGANCYTVPGRFELAVKLTQGDTVHTILRAEGSVTTSRTDAMTGAGSGVHSFDQLENRLDGLDTAMQQRSRVWNLLDNSDFRNPVNQRGASSVTANWGYIIDRWATPAASEATPISVSSNGVKLQNAKGTSTMSLRQLIENVPNGRYTAAADINGTVQIRVFTVTNGTISNASSTRSPEGQVYTDFSDSMLRFYVQAFEGHDVTSKWAALYEGEYTAETLPAYVPKGYAAELLECQRYYQTVSTQTPALVVSSTNRAYICNFRQRMRATPTVTVTSLTEYNNWTQTGATSSVNSVSPDYTRIYAASNVSNTGVGYWANITVAASADL